MSNSIQDPTTSPEWESADLEERNRSLTQFYDAQRDAEDKRDAEQKAIDQAKIDSAAGNVMLGTGGDSAADFTPSGFVAQEEINKQKDSERDLMLSLNTAVYNSKHASPEYQESYSKMADAYVNFADSPRTKEDVRDLTLNLVHQSKRIHDDSLRSYNLEQQAAEYARLKNTVENHSSAVSSVVSDVGEMVQDLAADVVNVIERNPDALAISEAGEVREQYDKIRMDMIRDLDENHGYIWQDAEKEVDRRIADATLAEGVFEGDVTLNSRKDIVEKPTFWLQSDELITSALDNLGATEQTKKRFLKNNKETQEHVLKAYRDAAAIIPGAEEHLKKLGDNDLDLGIKRWYQSSSQAGAAAGKVSSRVDDLVGGAAHLVGADESGDAWVKLAAARRLFATTAKGNAIYSDLAAVIPDLAISFTGGRTAASVSKLGKALKAGTALTKAEGIALQRISGYGSALASGASVGVGIFGEAREMGKSYGESAGLAGGAAVLTAGITAIGGPRGFEALAAGGAAGLKAARIKLTQSGPWREALKLRYGALAHSGKNIATNGFEEFVEEHTDEWLQSLIISKAMNPEMSFKDHADAAWQAGIIGATIGGGTGGIKVLTQKNTFKSEFNKVRNDAKLSQIAEDGQLAREIADTVHDLEYSDSPLTAEALTEQVIENAIAENDAREAEIQQKAEESAKPGKVASALGKLADLAASRQASQPSPSLIEGATDQGVIKDDAIGRQNARLIESLASVQRAEAEHSAAPTEETQRRVDAAKTNFAIQESVAIDLLTKEGISASPSTGLPATTKTESVPDEPGKELDPNAALDEFESTQGNKPKVNSGTPKGNSAAPPTPTKTANPSTPSASSEPQASDAGFPTDPGWNVAKYKTKADALEAASKQRNDVGSLDPNDNRRTASGENLNDAVRIVEMPDGSYEVHSTWSPSVSGENTRIKAIQEAKANPAQQSTPQPTAQEPSKQATETRPSQQVSEKLVPHSTENVEPAPTWEVAKGKAQSRSDYKAELDAWSDKHGRTHERDGTPIVRTKGEEVRLEVTKAARSWSFDESIDRLGVDANGVEMATAVNSLLDGGWVWDGERFSNPSNPKETPLDGLNRIKAKKAAPTQQAATAQPAASVSKPTKDTATPKVGSKTTVYDYTGKPVEINVKSITKTGAAKGTTQDGNNVITSSPAFSDTSPTDPSYRITSPGLLSGVKNASVSTLTKPQLTATQRSLQLRANNIPTDKTGKPAPKNKSQFAVLRDLTAVNTQLLNSSSIKPSTESNIPDKSNPVTASSQVEPTTIAEWKKANPPKGDMAKIDQAKTRHASNIEKHSNLSRGDRVYSDLYTGDPNRGVFAIQSRITDSTGKVVYQVNNEGGGRTMILEAAEVDALLSRPESSDSADISTDEKTTLSATSPVPPDKHKAIIDDFNKSVPKPTQKDTKETKAKKKLLNSHMRKVSRMVAEANPKDYPPGAYDAFLKEAVRQLSQSLHPDLPPLDVNLVDDNKKERNTKTLAYALRFSRDSEGKKTYTGGYIEVNRKVIQRLIKQHKKAGNRDSRLIAYDFLQSVDEEIRHAAALNALGYDGVVQFGKDVLLNPAAREVALLYGDGELFPDGVLDEDLTDTQLLNIGAETLNIIGQRIARGHSISDFYTAIRLHGESRGLKKTIYAYLKEFVAWAKRSLAISFSPELDLQVARVEQYLKGEGKNAFPSDISRVKSQLDFKVGDLEGLTPTTDSEFLYTANGKPKLDRRKNPQEWATQILEDATQYLRISRKDDLAITDSPFDINSTTLKLESRISSQFSGYAEQRYRVSMPIKSDIDRAIDIFNKSNDLKSAYDALAPGEDPKTNNPLQRVIKNYLRVLISSPNDAWKARRGIISPRDSSGNLLSLNELSSLRTAYDNAAILDVKDEVSFLNTIGLNPVLGGSERNHARTSALMDLYHNNVSVASIGYLMNSSFISIKPNEAVLLDLLAIRDSMYGTNAERAKTFYGRRVLKTLVNNGWMSPVVQEDGSKRYEDTIPPISYARYQAMNKSTAGKSLVLLTSEPRTNGDLLVNLSTPSYFTPEQAAQYELRRSAKVSYTLASRFTRAIYNSINYGDLTKRVLDRVRDNDPAAILFADTDFDVFTGTKHVLIQNIDRSIRGTKFGSVDGTVRPLPFPSTTPTTLADIEIDWLKSVKTFFEVVKKHGADKSLPNGLHPSLIYADHFIKSANAMILIHDRLQKQWKSSKDYNPDIPAPFPTPQIAEQFAALDTDMHWRMRDFNDLITETGKQATNNTSNDVDSIVDFDMLQRIQDYSGGRVINISPTRLLEHIDNRLSTDPQYLESYTAEGTSREGLQEVDAIELNDSILQRVKENGIPKGRTLSEKNKRLRATMLAVLHDGDIQAARTFASQYKTESELDAALFDLLANRIAQEPPTATTEAKLILQSVFSADNVDLNTTAKSLDVSKEPDKAYDNTETRKSIEVEQNAINRKLFLGRDWTKAVDSDLLDHTQHTSNLKGLLEVLDYKGVDPSYYEDLVDRVSIYESQSITLDSKLQTLNSDLPVSNNTDSKALSSLGDYILKLPPNKVELMDGANGMALFTPGLSLPILTEMTSGDILVSQMGDLLASVPLVYYDGSGYDDKASIDYNTTMLIKDKNGKVTALLVDYSDSQFTDPFEKATKQVVLYSLTQGLTEQSRAGITAIKKHLDTYFHKGLQDAAEEASGIAASRLHNSEMSNSWVAKAHSAAVKKAVASELTQLDDTRKAIYNYLIGVMPPTIDQNSIPSFIDFSDSQFVYLAITDPRLMELLSKVKSDLPATKAISTFSSDTVNQVSQAYLYRAQRQQGLELVDSSQKNVEDLGDDVDLEDDIVSVNEAFKRAEDTVLPNLSDYTKNPILGALTRAAFQAMQRAGKLSTRKPEVTTALQQGLVSPRQRNLMGDGDLSILDFEFKHKLAQKRKYLHELTTELSTKNSDLDSEYNYASLTDVDDAYGQDAYDAVTRPTFGIHAKLVSKVEELQSFLRSLPKDGQLTEDQATRRDAAFRDIMALNAKGAKLTAEEMGERERKKAALANYKARLSMQRSTIKRDKASNLPTLEAFGDPDLKPLNQTIKQIQQHVGRTFTEIPPQLSINPKQSNFEAGFLTDNTDSKDKVPWEWLDLERLNATKLLPPTKPRISKVVSAIAAPGATNSVVIAGHNLQLHIRNNIYANDPIYREAYDQDPNNPVILNYDGLIASMSQTFADPRSDKKIKQAARIVLEMAQKGKHSAAFTLGHRVMAHTISEHAAKTMMSGIYSKFRKKWWNHRRSVIDTVLSQDKTANDYGHDVFARLDLGLRGTDGRNGWHREMFALRKELEPLAVKIGKKGATEAYVGAQIASVSENSNDPLAEINRNIADLEQGLQYNQMFVDSLGSIRSRGKVASEMRAQIAPAQSAINRAKRFLVSYTGNDVSKDLDNHMLKAMSQNQRQFVLSSRVFFKKHLPGLRMLQGLNTDQRKNNKPLGVYSNYLPWRGFDLDNPLGPDIDLEVIDSDVSNSINKTYTGQRFAPGAAQEQGLDLNPLRAIMLVANSVSYQVNTHASKAHFANVFGDDKHQSQFKTVALSALPGNTTELTMLNDVLAKEVDTLTQNDLSNVTHDGWVYRLGALSGTIGYRVSLTSIEQPVLQTAPVLGAYAVRDTALASRAAVALAKIVATTPAKGVNTVLGSPSDNYAHWVDELIKFAAPQLHAREVNGINELREVIDRVRLSDLDGVIDKALATPRSLISIINTTQDWWLKLSTAAPDSALIRALWVANYEASTGKTIGPNSIAELDVSAAMNATNASEGEMALSDRSTKAGIFQPQQRASLEFMRRSFVVFSNHLASLAPNVMAARAMLKSDDPAMRAEGQKRRADFVLQTVLFNAMKLKHVAYISALIASRGIEDEEERNEAFIKHQEKSLGLAYDYLLFNNRRPLDHSDYIWSMWVKSGLELTGMANPIFAFAQVNSLVNTSVKLVTKALTGHAAPGMGDRYMGEIESGLNLLGAPGFAANSFLQYEAVHRTASNPYEFDRNHLALLYFTFGGNREIRQRLMDHVRENTGAREWDSNYGNKKLSPEFYKYKPQQLENNPLPVKPTDYVFRTPTTEQMEFARVDDIHEQWNVKRVDLKNRYSIGVSDGDSGLASTLLGENIYWRVSNADTPETSSDKGYKALQLHKQSEVFGLSEKQTKKYGSHARYNLMMLTKDKDVYVATKYEKVHGGRRSYVHLLIKQNGAFYDITKLQVGQGYASTNNSRKSAGRNDHGLSGPLSKELSQLKQIQEYARKNSLGIWGSPDRNIKPKVDMGYVYPY